MAKNVLDVVVSVVDKFSAGLDKFDKQLDGAKAHVEGMSDGFKKMAAYGTAALAGIGAAVGTSVSAFGEAERSQRQLEHAVLNVSKGTNEQVEAISALSTALQNKSGIDGDALKMGAAQLSTFGLQSESVVNLTKSLADLTVNQSGLTAGGDDYVQSANTIAKALKGQFGVLEKSGIRFTEAQQQMIQFGTETEKVAALQEGFAQNLKETTDTVGGVDLATAKLKNSFGEIQEALGGAFSEAMGSFSAALVPILDKISAWISENPKLTAAIVAVGATIAAATVAVGAFGLILPKIIGGVQGLVAVFKLAAANPMILAITALVAAGWYMIENWEMIAGFWSDVWDAVSAKVVEIWEAISTFFIEIFTTIKEVFTTAIDGISTFLSDSWTTITDAISTAWDGIKTFFSDLWEGIVEIFTLAFDALMLVIGPALDAMTLAFQLATDAIALVFSTLWNGLKTTFEIVWGIFSGVVAAAIAVLTGDFSGAWDIIKETFIGAWDAIKEAFSNVWDGIKDIAGKAIDWIIDKLRKMQNLAISAINLLPFVDIPKAGAASWMSNGGIVKPLYAADGAFVPRGTDTVPAMLTPGEIVLNKAQQKNLVGHMRGGVTVNITGTFLDQKSAEKIGNLIIQKLRKNINPG